MARKYVYRKKCLIALFTVLDFIGNIVFLPVRHSSSKRDEAKDGKILLIRADHIGDVVSATAVIDPLRKTFPRTVIDLLAPSGCADLLAGDPQLNNVLSFDAPWFDRRSFDLKKHFRGWKNLVRIIKSGGYDTVIDLRGDFRHILAMFAAGVPGRISYGITGGGFLLTCEVPYEGVMHEADRNVELLRPLGVSGEAGKVRLSFAAESGKGTSRMRDEAGISGDYAVLHPMPGHSAKEWSIDGFSYVARYLKEKKGLRSVLVGGKGEKDYVHEIVKDSESGAIDLSGRTGLAELGELVKNAKLFVGVDSGPAHIAAACGTPSVVLFSGANDPRQWAPRGDNVRVIYPGEGKDLLYISPKQACRVTDEVLAAG